MGHENKHGHFKMEMPDYRQWKIEGTPLEAVQKKLSRRGLKDPWLRNEAWRFTGAFGKSPGWWGVLGQGFKYGFAAFVVALAVEHAVKKFWLKNKDDGHH